MRGPLERNIFIRNRPRAGSCVLRLRHPLIEVVAAAGCCAARAAEISSTARAFAPSAEQDQIIHHDLCHVLLLTTRLVVPGMGSQAAFDIDFAALLYILTNNFRGTRPRGNVVPLGAVLPLALFVL